MTKSSATDQPATSNITAFSANILEATKLWQKALSEIGQRIEQESDELPIYAAIQQSMAEAFSSAWYSLLKQPEKMVDAQFDYYRESIKLWEHSLKRMMGEQETHAPTPIKDRRFKDDLWQQNIVFDIIKHHYLFVSQWTQKTLLDLDELPDDMRQKVEFYSKQWLDALSPSNFLATNPQVLQETLNSNGENLVRGMRNLLTDLRSMRHAFLINSADEQAFTLGKDLAATPGKIVFQNRLLQLIQYNPTTETVHKVPLFIVSPWINKYYILDMQKHNSMVQWLIDQGYTVFITSWVNPDASLADVTFEDYMQQGVLDGIAAITKTTGEPDVNIIGYCIGGTLLASTLAALHAKKKAEHIRSATFFTTLTDFSDPGDLGIFIDDAMLGRLEEQLKNNGIFPGQEMAKIFSMLRANEMIWAFVVNNYLMGRAPFPFDLLYWNADCTSMPGAMHLFYLREMYRNNSLIRPGALTLLDEKIDLGAIQTPSYFLSTREDHIAPWRATWNGAQLFGKQPYFVLSGSGHVAGVVNPPSANKYQYWVNEAKNTPKDPETWLQNAAEKTGSWWEDWHNWMCRNSHNGERVAARNPAKGKLKPIEDAPGSYVKVRS